MKWLGLIAALSSGLPALCVRADDRFDVALGVTSDYVLRGLTQTQGDAAVQADLHWQHDDTWVAGVWMSTMNPRRGRGPTSEFDLYAGASRNLGDDWRASLMAVHYVFPQDSARLRWDYDELIASVGFRDLLIGTVAWSPNASGFGGGQIASERRAISYELMGHWPLRQRWLASAGAGYYDLHDLFDTGYVYWSVGVTFDWAPWKATLARYGTNDQAKALYGDAITQDRWAAGITWQFGGAIR